MYDSTTTQSVDVGRFIDERNISDPANPIGLSVLTVRILDSHKYVGSSNALLFCRRGADGRFFTAENKGARGFLQDSSSIFDQQTPTIVDVEAPKSQ